MARACGRDDDDVNSGNFNCIHIFRMWVRLNTEPMASRILIVLNHTKGKDIRRGKVVKVRQKKK